MYNGTGSGQLKNSFFYKIAPMNFFSQKDFQKEHLSSREKPSALMGENSAQHKILT
jgi:hypothetical protein